MIRMVGKAILERVVAFDNGDGGKHLSVADYRIVPPAVNPHTGRDNEIARVARYPAGATGRTINMVTPVDYAGVEHVLHPWFQFTTAEPLTDAETLERIGYTLEVVSDVE